MADNTIQWDKDADGIVTLTMDDPSGSANVMNEAYLESMGKAVDRLVAEKDSIAGVVITSAKKTFFAGGDLTAMINAGPEDAGQSFDTVETVKKQLRTLETLGKLAGKLPVSFDAKAEKEWQDKVNNWKKGWKEGQKKIAQEKVLTLLRNEVKKVENLSKIWTKEQLEVARKIKDYLKQ